MIEMSSANGRLLNYSLKIVHRAETIYFFKNILGMKILRHTESSEDLDLCGERWSKTMVGYGPEEKYFALELIFDYRIESYSKGNGFIGITIKDGDCLRRAKTAKWPIIEGNVLYAPGGYKFVIINEAKSSNSDPIVKITLGVYNEKKSIEYWVKLLGLKVLKGDIASESVLLGFGKPATKLELKKICNRVRKGENTGRLVLGLSYGRLKDLEAKINKTNRKVLIPLVPIETPGKAKLNVLAIEDPDGYECYFLETKEFLRISKYSPDDEKVLNRMMTVEKQISEMLSKDVKENQPEHISNECLGIKAVNLIKQKAQCFFQERRVKKLNPVHSSEVGTDFNGRSVDNFQEKLLAVTNLSQPSELSLKKLHLKKQVKNPKSYTKELYTSTVSQVSENSLEHCSFTSSKSDSITKMIQEEFGAIIKPKFHPIRLEMGTSQKSSKQLLQPPKVTSSTFLKKAESNQSYSSKPIKTALSGKESSTLPENCPKVCIKSLKDRQIASSSVQGTINLDDFKKYNLCKKAKETGKDIEGQDIIRLCVGSEKKLDKKSDSTEVVRERKKKEESEKTSKFDDSVRRRKSVTLRLDDSANEIKVIQRKNDNDLGKSEIDNATNKLYKELVSSSLPADSLFYSIYSSDNLPPDNLPSENLLSDSLSFDDVPCKRKPHLQSGKIKSNISSSKVPQRNLPPDIIQDKIPTNKKQHIKLRPNNLPNESRQSLPPSKPSSKSSSRKSSINALYNNKMHKRVSGTTLSSGSSDQSSKYNSLENFQLVQYRIKKKSSLTPSDQSLTSAEKHYIFKRDKLNAVKRKIKESKYNHCNEKIDTKNERRHSRYERWNDRPKTSDETYGRKKIVVNEARIERHRDDRGNNRIRHIDANQINGVDKQISKFEDDVHPFVNIVSMESKEREYKRSTVDDLLRKLGDIESIRTDYSTVTFKFKKK